MLTSIEGTYRNGQIEFTEPPPANQEATPVIVTFMYATSNATDIDLRAHGINQEQAAELRAALTTVEDWNDPEMAIYDDYDAAKAKL